VWPSWKAAGIHPVAHFHMLPFATCIPITASRSIPRRRPSLLGTRCPLPQIHRPCGATIISNPPLRPAHYPMFDPLLLPGCLATSVPAPPHACLSSKQNTACAPPCGAIPAQATSTPSLGAWGSIPHHHTLLVVRVTSTVTSAVPVPALRWFVMHSSVSATAAMLSTLSLYPLRILRHQ